jgi:hypothetical protein
VKHDISDLASPNFWAPSLLVFYNRDDDDDATGHLAQPNQRRARSVVVVKITFGEAK